jgi:hypothetical protein
VQPVGELDENDTNVVRHRQHHLAEILRLLFLITPKCDFADLRHPIDQMHHILSELSFEFFRRCDRIFQGIVQQCCDDGGDICFERGQDSGDGDGMLNIRFSGKTTLTHVRLGRKFVGLPNEAEIGIGIIAFNPIQQLVEFCDGLVHHGSLTYSLALSRTSRIRS